jgi:nitronate monooxygenase
MDLRIDSTVSACGRSAAFCRSFGMEIPVLQAPMAGACPSSLAISVANAGGMGGMGALLSTPEEILAWAAEFRAQSNGSFQLNLWIPNSPPARNMVVEARVRDFLSNWGPAVPVEAADVKPPDFARQCEAFLSVRPTVVSSIMGVYPPAFVANLKDRGIAWFAGATTLAEAREAETAGADAIVAQGFEAGAMREAGNKSADRNRMQLWAGQSASLARPEPAADFIRRIWAQAEALLP